MTRRVTACDGYCGLASRSQILKIVLELELPAAHFDRNERYAYFGDRTLVQGFEFEDEFEDD